MKQPKPVIAQVTSNKMVFVGILIVGSLERQVIGVLIVSFPEHQQHNASLQKESSGGSGPATSPMIKSTKKCREGEENRCMQLELLTFPSRGYFRLIGLGSRNPLLPFWGRILSPPSLRDEIFFSLSTTSSSLSGIIFSFSRIISPRSKGFRSWKIR